MPLFAHIGIGLGAKRIAPRVPGWVLVTAALFLDLISIFVLILGNELYWITHGLAMSIIWTFIVFFIVYLILQIARKKKKITNLSSKGVIRISAILSILVFSHWVLDFIGWPLSALSPTNTHCTPLLFANTPAFSLGVYTTLEGALIMEFSFLIPGIMLYRNAKKKIT